MSWKDEQEPDKCNRRFLSPTSVVFPVITAISQTSVLPFTDSVQECPRNCHGNGECVSGVCHCFPGFHGMDCSKGRRPSNLHADLCHKCTHGDWQGKASNPLVHARVKEETRICIEKIVCSVVFIRGCDNKDWRKTVKSRKHEGREELRHKVERSINKHKRKKEVSICFVDLGYK